MNRLEHQPTNSRKNRLFAAVLSLAECCPLSDCNPEDCPLHHVRKLKPPQRIKWLGALAEDDLAYLVAYHHVCLSINVAAKA